MSMQHTLAQSTAVESSFAVPVPQPVPSLLQTLHACYEGVSVHLGPFRKIKSAAVIALYGLAALVPQIRLRRESRSNAAKNWTAEGLERLYLGCRESLPFYNNYPVVLVRDEAATQPIARAAKLIRGMLLLNEAVAHGALDREFDRYGTLDSYQLRRCFSTSRVAGVECDCLATAQGDARIAVMVRGRAYSMFLAEPSAKPAFDRDSVTGALKEIVRDSEEAGPGETPFPIGFLTALPRAQWAEARAALAQSPHNRRSLRLLEESLFLVCLDLDSRPDEIREAAAEVRAGNCSNRYYDKSLQLIVFANGVAGFNAEHAAIDGSVAIRIASHLRGYAEASGSGGPATGVLPRGRAVSWERIEFEVDERQIRLAVAAGEQVERLRESRAMTGMMLSGYGKNLCTGYGVSADAAVQLTIQLAAYLCFGKIVTIFEPIHVRHFAGGRIDFVPAVTAASKRFVLDAASNRDRGADLQARLREAAAAHQALIRDVKRGHGFVGHLLALAAVQYRNDPAKGERINSKLRNMLIRIDKGVGSIIKQEIFAASGSAAGGAAVFGTICTRKDMLGIGYIVGADAVVFDIVAEGRYRPLCRQFLAALSGSFELIKEVLQGKTPKWED